MKKIIFLALSIMFSLGVFAQNETHKWAVGGGISAIDFSGPLTKSFFDFDNYKGSGRFFVGRYLNPSFNLKADFTFGKVWYPHITAYPDVAADYYDWKHIYDFGVNVEYKFNNGYIFKEDAIVAPYIHTGFGFNSIVDYDFNTYVPFGIGLNIRPLDWLTFNLQSTYKLNIDNSYDYTQHSASAVFNFGKSKKVKEVEEAKDASDADKDGVPDLIDECPFAAGTAELFGCPDSDGDGLGDSRDNCPNEIGALENKGCPSADADGDGVPDDKDSCPNEKGDKRYAGCPDSDGDGIVDKYDKCPNEAGVASNSGCPKEGVVEVTPTEPTTPVTPTEPTRPVDPVKPVKPSEPIVGTVENVTTIYFASGSDVVTSSEKVKIDRVLATLNSNSSYKLKVKGYTDAPGDEMSNLNLSLRRAQNVWKYLQSKGYDGSKVELYGFGEYHNTNTDAAKDRKVELEIIK